MDKNSKIFISGHNGLVGSSIIRNLKTQGYGNLVTANKSALDLRDQYAVNTWFRYNRPEYIFLAAAKVGGIAYNAKAPGDLIYDNIMIQTNVINSAKDYGAKKLLFLGSACIYPKVTPQPIKEEYLLTSKLEPTNEGYALAKILGLRICEYYRKQFGFNAISCMPTNIYGPNDNFDPEKCHVIPGMITKFNHAIKNGHDTITCWGDGTPKREFLYSDDLADACIFLMNNYDSDEFINVGSDVEITIKDLAEIIKKEMCFSGTVIWDVTLPNGTLRRKLDNTKLATMGWKPKVSFEEGLAKTIKWFKENKDE